MRLRTMALALAGLPLALGGCGGSSTPGASASAFPSASAAAPWMVMATGSATPSPTPTISYSGPTGLPSVSFLATDPACATAWPTDATVFIPMTVTAAKASLQVQWSAQYGPTYRIAAVDQRLVSGAQPPPTWKTVTVTNGCTGSTTITGLTSGVPYIVWLDAPDTPHKLDGSRDLYSGRSGIVNPL
jgi:hypothetical protein